MDRYAAAFLADREGQLFKGRINGVTRFGLFVTLEESGASGLVPMGSLPDDWYDHDERAHALIGRRWGREYRLGEPVHLRLVEADPATGGLLLHIIEGEEAAAEPAPLRHAEGRPAGRAGAGKPGGSRKAGAAKRHGPPRGAGKGPPHKPGKGPRRGKKKR
jgi:ribonuclease R